MSRYPDLSRTLPFPNYIEACRDLISTRRLDLHKNSVLNQNIINFNCPYELFPEKKAAIKSGVLLVHGLFDCPFSLRELGQQLQNNGILTRSILLPGHGTHPSDLISVHYQDWVDTVSYGIQSMLNDVDHLFLMGYSTGAALSVYEALQNTQIAGVVLLAPALKIRTDMKLVVGLQFVKKLLKNKPEWIYTSPELDYTKYLSIAFNPVFQLATLIEKIEVLQKTHTLPCPMLVITSREDETICSDTAIDFFSRYHHEQSRLVLFTSWPHPYPDKRIKVKETCYPEAQINHLSHIAIPFSRANKHYGEAGDYPRASHPNPNVIDGAYNHLEENFFSWAYRWGLVRKKRRTLTFNPAFDYMIEEIIDFIN